MTHKLCTKLEAVKIEHRVGMMELLLNILLSIRLDLVILNSNYLPRIDRVVERLSNFYIAFRFMS